MHADDGLLLDPLEGFDEFGGFSFSELSATAQLSKAGDDQVPDLLKVWIAGDEEHVPSDAILKHLFAGDTVVAESEEDPADVGLNLHVVYVSKRMKQRHYALLNQNLDRKLTQCKVHQRQSRELLYLQVVILLYTQVHYHVDDPI